MKKGSHTMSKGARSQYLEIICLHTQLALNRNEPKNDSLLRQKNTKEITIVRKGTRIDKGGEDLHGLQTKNLKNAKLFNASETVTQLL